MTLNLAVCGAGAFGRNHIRLYRELPGVHLAAIVDPALTDDPAPFAAPTPQQPSSPTNAILSEAKDRLAPAPPAIFPSITALLHAIHQGQLHIDAASVCVPTSAHHEVASQLLQAGIHVLVEKPIASTLAQADDLIALAQKHHRVLMVGHLERFNPSVQAVLPLLRGPMFFEAHRLSIFSPRSLDVDVVLDLMIHDLDIVLTLAQSPVAHVHAVGLPILSPKTDIANVRVEFASGCVANFTASRVSTERVRKLRFFQPHQYLSIDYARQDLLIIEVTPPNPSDLSATTTTTDQATTVVTYPATTAVSNQPTPALAPHPPAQLPNTVIPALPTLAMQKPAITPGEPLRLELEAFLHAIRSNTAPTVTGQQARDALALALQIQQAIATHAQHAGLQAFTTR